MTSDDLDRILTTDEPLVPSSGFAASVMESVRETASAPPPLPFPWRRFLLGLFVLAALSGICGWLAARLPMTEALAAAAGNARAALADPLLSMPLELAAAALAGTYLLVRMAFRFTGTRR